MKVCTTDEGTSLFLEDASGVFLEVPLETEDDPEAKSTTSDREVEEEQSIESLWQALHMAHLENEALVKELCEVRTELDNNKNRVCELWEVGCDRLTAFDTALEAKDREMLCYVACWPTGKPSD